MPSIVFDTQPETSNKYVDLAPVDDADQNGVYSEAIDFAIKNSNVYNIALTGPYGSGKSSIIKTYGKNSDINILNISLACFQSNIPSSKDEENIAQRNDTIDDVLIEKSILQQILYAAPPEAVPYSRIKRIREPQNIKTNAIVLSLWVFFLFLTSMYSEIMTTHTFHGWWRVINFLIISYTISVPIVFLMDLYRFLSISSFKKISLRNGELEVGDDKNDSYLNKNLDEILYFFNKTSYHLVVFEDLDRFGSPSIFVKLREINTLINSSNNRKVKFLYAVKDDMFTNNERAKFFDFIIPVIPVINNSNSLDKIQERLKAHALDNDIDQQFIREVSLYIDDLRLIQNIFNEFCIYEQQLKSSKYDKTKLLAILIYKNLYPGDFEKLHHRQGAFFAICEEKARLIEGSRSKLVHDINTLKEKIDASDKETILGLEELISIFLFRLICDFTEGKIISISGNGKSYDINSSSDIATFEDVISDPNMSVRYTYNNGYQNERVVGSSRSIENKAYNGSTYINRKEIISNKHHSKRQAIFNEIDRLEKEINDLIKSPLCKLLSSNRTSISLICRENNMLNSDLFSFLLLSGYLSEDYHYYISSFHEGRLSKNDREYLLIIRSEKEPDSTFSLDNPQEIILNMRSSDFDSIYALNVTLIDSLLQGSHEEKIKSVSLYISSDFEKCEVFFENYWKDGLHIGDFCRKVTFYWNEYAVAATRLKASARHIASVIKYCAVDFITSRMNEDDALSLYLSEYYSQVYNDNLFSSENFDVMKALEVKVLDLGSAIENEKLFIYCYTNNLYIINQSNIETIFTFFGCDTSELNDKNYTVIMNSSLKELKIYIDKYLPQYVDTVLLSNKSNSQEDPQYLLKALKFECLSLEQKKLIIASQEHIFIDISVLPKDIWLECFTLGKIDYTWHNVLAFYDFNKSDNCQNPIELIDVIKQPMLMEGLERLGTPTISDLLLNFAQQIVQLDLLNDNLYERLIKLLPYSWINYPKNISIGKMIILCTSGKIAFNAESLSDSTCDDELLNSYVNKHLLELQKPNNIPLYIENIYILKNVLISLTDMHQRFTLIKDISIDVMSKSLDIANLISETFAQSESDLTQIDDTIIDYIICNTTDTNHAISILLKVIKSCSPNRIKNILEKLPAPYCDIYKLNSAIYFENTNDNAELARELKKLNLISSSRKNLSNIRIETLRQEA